MSFRLLNPKPNLVTLTESALLSVYEYSFLDNTPLCMFPEFINKLSPIIEENAMILKFFGE
jgi:hypothetical protein